MIDRNICAVGSRTVVNFFGVCDFDILGFADDLWLNGFKWDGIVGAVSGISTCHLGSIGISASIDCIFKSMIRAGNVGQKRRCG